MNSDEALEFLRQQLKRDYPEGTPTFRRGATKPEKIRFFFDDMVIPAFEKIQKQFDSFHFEVKTVSFPFRTRLEVTDGCSQFYFSIFVDKKHSFAGMTVEYRDHSIYPQHSQYFQKKYLLNERFDLSRIEEEFSEDLIITIFSDAFVNRKENLRSMIKREEIDLTLKEQMEREERRAKLIALKRINDSFDPKDEFKKYLESDEYSGMRNWLDFHYNLKISPFEDEDTEKSDD